MSTATFYHSTRNIVKTAEFWNAIAAPKGQLKNDLEDVRAGRHLSRAYTNPEELFEELGI